MILSPKKILSESRKLIEFAAPGIMEMCSDIRKVYTNRSQKPRIIYRRMEIIENQRDDVGPQRPDR